MNHNLKIILSLDDRRDTIKKYNFEECLGFGGYLIDIENKLIANENTFRIFKNTENIQINRSKKYNRNSNWCYPYKDIEKIHLENKEKNIKNIINNKIRIRKSHSTSILSQQWIDYLRIRKPNIQHFYSSNEEYEIPNSLYKADGYDKDTNTIYEFNGDFWHGNPRKYNKNKINSVNKKSFGELYENSLKKQEFCKLRGYNYIYIWEDEWNKAINIIRLIQIKFRLSKNKQNTKVAFD